MSVLMRGVDMPKNCEECNFKGECRDYWEKIREAYTRPSWCPLVEVTDRKTESNSEKPNNSTISILEQVDEPKTQMKTQNSNLTFEKQTDCPWK